MRTQSIEISIPEDILFALKLNKEVLKKEMLTICAVQFFKTRKISLGKAAELAGMDKNDFVDILNQYEIDIYQYTDEDLKNEIDFIDANWYNH